MRLVGFASNGSRHIGTIEGEFVRDLGPADAFYANVGRARARSDGDRIPLESVAVAPPVPETSRVFCVGVNYLSHAGEAEKVGIDLPQHPMIFGRWAQSLVGDGEPVPVPPHEAGLDWEVELAVVIGSEAWETNRSTALEHVFGYTAFNDLSARRKQGETTQFTLGKNADRSGPIGPELVTADEFGDPGDVHIETRVNGVVMQSATTADLIFGVAELIDYITDTVTLLPGDVIATGTPSGVGVALSPPMYLVPGDIVEVEVEGIGILRTPIVSRAEFGERPTAARRAS